METNFPGHRQYMRYQPPRRLAIGIGASIAAHVVLVLAFRAESLRELKPVHASPVEAMLVWIKPRPPAPEPEPLARFTTPQPVSRPVRRAQASAEPPREAAQEDANPPEAVSALAPRPEDDPFYVQPVGQQQPFSMDAARVAARQVATSPDPARADLPVGQFDKERNRVKPDNPVARKIAQAKRRDCKDGVPGGLLAPFLLLMDKKDHGCKW